jgi:hypothetical protein
MILFSPSPGRMPDLSGIRSLQGPNSGKPEFGYCVPPFPLPLPIAGGGEGKMSIGEAGANEGEGVGVPPTGS